MINIKQNDTIYKYLDNLVFIINFLAQIIQIRKKQIKKQDGNSLKLVWVILVISITAGVFSLIYVPALMVDTNMISLTGLGVIILGMIIRFISIRTLGKFFTLNLGTDSDHSLIKSGFFKFIRHPSYTGSLLSFFGLVLSFNNWVSLAVIFIPVLITFICRINIEEKLLLNQIGEEYEQYKKKTKRLIPSFIK